MTLLTRKEILEMLDKENFLNRTNILALLEGVDECSGAAGMWKAVDEAIDDSLGDEAVMLYGKRDADRTTYGIHQGAFVLAVFGSRNLLILGYKEVTYVPLWEDDKGRVTVSTECVDSLSDAVAAANRGAARARRDDLAASYREAVESLVRYGRRAPYALGMPHPDDAALRDYAEAMAASWLR